MNIEITNDIAVVATDEVLIYNEQSALDFLATVGFEHQVHKIILDKKAISEDFFDLSTQIAGNILQKFINYNFKLAIIGDFSVYHSSALKAFIVECNRGNSIFFLSSVEEALDKLS